MVQKEVSHKNNSFAYNYKPNIQSYTRNDESLTGRFHAGFSSCFLCSLFIYANPDFGVLIAERLEAGDLGNEKSPVGSSKIILFPFKQFSVSDWSFGSSTAGVRFQQTLV